MKRISPLLCIVMLLSAGLAAALTLPALEQVTGTVAGTVTGEDGKPVVAATIRLEGTTQGAKSKVDGSFIIRDVRAGDYVLLVTSVGFEPFRRTIRVSVQQTTTVTIKLSTKPIKGGPVKVAAMRDVVRPEKAATVRSVQMEGSRSAPTSESSATSGTMQTSTAPTIQGAVALQPGVSTAGVNGQAIHGGRATATSVRVDGVEVSDPFGGGYANIPTSPSSPATPSAAVDETKPIDASEPVATSEAITENQFISPHKQPLSTFSIDVDAASYSLIRRYTASGKRPPADMVRIEEMINYFDYEYPEPNGEDPFSIVTEVSACPWNQEHKLIHIGMQGRRIEKESLPPGNIVFLIDVSGSMSSDDRLPLLKDAFRLLVAELRPEDRVAIVVYAGAAGIVLPPTSGADRDTILAALERLRAGGSTAGGEGIVLAYETAKQMYTPEGNNRVILATDGDFNVGVSSDDGLVKLIEEKRKEGMYLTVLGFGMGNFRDGKMEKLADNGNGNYAYIDDIAEARKVLVNELGATLLTIAKDVKLQIEFNPATVESYRLIGYENRMLAKEDFDNDAKDAGDLGAGHSVTALYEVVPARHTEERLRRDDMPSLSDNTLKYRHGQSITDTYADELMEIKLRYKSPLDSTSRLIVHPAINRETDLASTSDNFRFSAAVAELGLLLRGSKLSGKASYEEALRLARGSLGADTKGYRKEFVEIAERCSKLGK